MPEGPKQSAPHPAHGRACGLDLGKARVGVAVSDELGMYAHPRGVISGKNQPELIKALCKLVDDEGIDQLVIGLPLDMKGGEGDGARRTREIAQRIANATGVEVALWDERLTTVEARRNLASSEVHGRKAKAHIDEASAVVLLQAWLDQQPRARR
ncbi:MAG: Holliday junction resolvase RuvX [Polyangiaceae bacterium]